MLNKEAIRGWRTVTNGKNQKGHTLLEVLVAMTIFLGVTGSIWGVLRIGQQSRTTVNLQVPLSKNVRVALNILGRDAYNAGYGYPLGNVVLLPDNRISTLLGIPPDTDVLRDTVPPVIVGNDITLNTFNTNPGVKTDQVTFLFKDPTFNVIGTIGPPDTRYSQPLNTSVPTTNAGVDEIQIQLPGTNAVCRVNDIYLVSNATGSALGLATAMSGTDKVRFAPGGSDLLGFNQSGALPGAITTAASMQRVQMVTYFVTAAGILTRREFGNVLPAAAFVDEPLVYGVEDFQVKYVMDTGAVTDNPSAGPDGIPGNGDDTQSNLAAVRQIRFTVSVRSTELDSTGQPTRVTQTSTFSTRNLGYDAS